MFDGYISQLQYHRKALSHLEIEDIIKNGLLNKQIDA